MSEYYYYQIKGKAGSEDNVQSAYPGQQYSTWVWPPIYSGRVEAEDIKEARKKIEELYDKKSLPRKVLKKNLDDNEFLLHIEPIKPNSHINRLFELQTCKICQHTFYVIDKYNDRNEKDKGSEFCSTECYLEFRRLQEIEYWDKVNNINNEIGIHKPCIYKITNKVTGLCYIGKTTQAFTFRWYQHFFQSQNNKFHQAIHQYKVSDWIFEVIEVIIEKKDNDYILERERYYIDLFDTIKNGYNTL